MKKITDKTQQVACDILLRLGFCETKEQFWAEYNNIKRDYELCDDPFTNLPCTSKEYEKNSEEYHRQLMEDKYGYWE